MVFIFSLFVLMNFSYADSSASLKIFQDHLAKMQKLHQDSEGKLMKYGESYLKKHAIAAERLSLAELLPKTKRDLPKFCRTYQRDIMVYYNLSSIKDIQKIKSPSFKEFYKLIRDECVPKM